MDNYGFTLDWNDLPEELREEKIEEYVKYCNENRSEDEDVMESDSAEQDIKTHFPIYF